MDAGGGLSGCTGLAMEPGENQTAISLNLTGYYHIGPDKDALVIEYTVATDEDVLYSVSVPVDDVYVASAITHGELFDIAWDSFSLNIRAKDPAGIQPGTVIRWGVVFLRKGLELQDVTAVIKTDSGMEYYQVKVPQGIKAPSP